ncbi:galactokinase family protein [Aestuariimicrobium kwangyangense]|uniref:galactokinase family protein n=1 Tax=Aestuariimicrobium kwangyangense TaxID=396389 RepID=UPI0003B49277|nr:galactokinase family protein [Aestuariimicrobium kwangyangense]
MSAQTGRRVDAVVRWFVPGRIEVLGKHTDYAGGRSLLAAVDRGVTVEARFASGDEFIGRTDATPGEVVLMRTGEAPRSGHGASLPEGHWGHYLATVVDRLGSNFGALPPAEIEVSSDLPLASGMSSSSALITAIALALVDLNSITDHPAWRENIATRIDLAGYVACIENGMSFGSLAGHRGVGTFGGSEDHTGMLCGVTGHLGQFSFCPIREEAQIPFPDDLSFVVAVSGVAAEKTGAARDLYNRASLSTLEIVDRWNAQTGRSDVVLADAVASSPDAPDRLRALVAGDDRLAKRLHQFLEESDRIVPAAAAALAAGDLVGFGRLVDQSQRLTTTDLGNQVDETVALARLARERGALAASAFGAGFGGSVWALVPTVDAEEFAAGWLAEYRAQFPDAGARATTLVTRPGDPARPVAIG